MFLRRRAPEPGTCATVLRKCSAQRGRRTAKKRAVSRRGPEVARWGDTRPAPTARQRPGSAEAHGDLRTRGLIPPRAHLSQAQTGAGAMPRNCVCGRRYQPPSTQQSKGRPREARPGARDRIGTRPQAPRPQRGFSHAEQGRGALSHSSSGRGNSCLQEREPDSAAGADGSPAESTGLSGLLRMRQPGCSGEEGKIRYKAQGGGCRVGCSLLPPGVAPGPSSIRGIGSLLKVQHGRPRPGPALC